MSEAEIAFIIGALLGSLLTNITWVIDELRRKS